MEVAVSPPGALGGSTLNDRRGALGHRSTPMEVAGSPPGALLDKETKRQRDKEIERQTKRHGDGEIISAETETETPSDNQAKETGRNAEQKRRWVERRTAEGRPPFQAWRNSMAQGSIGPQGF